MINAGRDFALRGKGKAAENRNSAQRILFRARRKHLRDCHRAFGVVLLDIMMKDMLFSSRYLIVP